jgi:hypothetical protein
MKPWIVLNVFSCLYVSGWFCIYFFWLSKREVIWVSPCSWKCNYRLIFLVKSAVGMDHVRVHPKFLHSNATSHKWALGGKVSIFVAIVNYFHNIEWTYFLVPHHFGTHCNIPYFDCFSAAFAELLDNALDEVFLASHLLNKHRVLLFSSVTYLNLISGL